MLQKSSGNIQRIITHVEDIGVDRVTNTLTKQYTVITRLLTNGREKLITTFPGSPTR